MRHQFREACFICGSAVDSSDGTYCAKHSDYENRPDDLTPRYCSWCGRSLPRNRDDDADADECDWCVGKAAAAEEKMDELAQDYKALPEDSTPDWFWRTCSYCGIRSIFVRLYRARGIWGVGHFFTGNTEPTGNIRCENCKREFSDD
jgi:hypothetical protein